MSSTVRAANSASWQELFRILKASLDAGAVETWKESKCNDAPGVGALFHTCIVEILAWTPRPVKSVLQKALSEGSWGLSSDDSRALAAAILDTISTCRNIKKSMSSGSKTDPALRQIIAALEGSNCLPVRRSSRASSTASTNSRGKDQDGSQESLVATEPRKSKSVSPRLPSKPGSSCKAPEEQKDLEKDDPLEISSTSGTDVVASTPVKKRKVGTFSMEDLRASAASFGLATPSPLKSGSGSNASKTGMKSEESKEAAASSGKAKAASRAEVSSPWVDWSEKLVKRTSSDGQVEVAASLKSGDNGFVVATFASDSKPIVTEMPNLFLEMNLQQAWAKAKAKAKGKAKAKAKAVQKKPVAAGDDGHAKSESESEDAAVKKKPVAAGDDAHAKSESESEDAAPAAPAPAAAPQPPKVVPKKPAAAAAGAEEDFTGLEDFGRYFCTFATEKAYIQFKMQSGKKKLLIGVDRAMSPGSFTEVVEALFEYLQLLLADAEGNLTWDSLKQQCREYRKNVLGRDDA